MKTSAVLFHTWVLGALISLNVHSQEIPTTIVYPDSTLRVVLNDGSVFLGVRVSETDETIGLNTRYFGVVEIPTKEILRIEILDSARIIDGEIWFENPNATRYLFGPSAIPLKKGEGYFQNVYIVLQSFNYAVANNVSIGGGFDVITPFVSEVPLFFFITPKASFQLAEKIYIGAGLLYANTTAFELSGSGIGYGILTYGTVENNMTAGIGWGYLDGETTNGPIITVSGMARLSRRLGFVSENWFVPVDGYYGVLSYGLRFMSDKITVDLAFINNPDIFSEIFIGIPYVDFVVRFGD